MSKATRATLANLGAGLAVSAFHALVSARMPLTMTGTLSQSARSQGQGSMSTFKADSAFMLRPRSPRPFSAISSGFVQYFTLPRSGRFLLTGYTTCSVCFSSFFVFLPERDYVTFGSLLSQICLSSVCHL